MAIVPKAQKGKWQFSVPVKSPEEQLQILADNISKLKSPDELPQIPNLKLRKRKYETEEDAKIVIPNRDELACIHKIIDQYDEKVIKIQELLSITDKDHVVFQQLGYIQENPNNSSEDDNDREQDRDNEE
ncbi:MAG: hypothetical protein EZS28_044296 [Streblomastix strix]|uniref:Uncharacterized protein n=1 Tax=Streblomastix strix TaxID=222440 RepID=A0A5J4TQK9_9EUKA|nr:MAG: hypothetical protein EZS28_044296 [Streblomastix strix]